MEPVPLPCRAPSECRDRLGTQGQTGNAGTQAHRALKPSCLRRGHFSSGFSRNQRDGKDWAGGVGAHLRQTGCCPGSVGGGSTQPWGPLLLSDTCQRGLSKAGWEASGLLDRQLSW